MIKAERTTQTRLSIVAACLTNFKGTIEVIFLTTNITTTHKEN